MLWSRCYSFAGHQDWQRLRNWCWLLDSDLTRIFAEGGTLFRKGNNLHDNFIVNMKFTDDFIASLVYSDLGNPKFLKERLEIFAGNRTC